MKVGSGLSVTADGTISTSGSGGGDDIYTVAVSVDQHGENPTADPDALKEIAQHDHPVLRCQTAGAQYVIALPVQRVGAAYIFAYQTGLSAYTYYVNTANGTISLTDTSVISDHVTASNSDTAGVTDDWHWQKWQEGFADCYYYGILTYPTGTDTPAGITGENDAPWYINYVDVPLPIDLSGPFTATASIQWGYSNFVQAQPHYDENSEKWVVRIRRFANANGNAQANVETYIHIHGKYIQGE